MPCDTDSTWPVAFIIISIISDNWCLRVLQNNPTRNTSSSLHRKIPPVDPGWQTDAETPVKW